MKRAGRVREPVEPTAGHHGGYEALDDEVVNRQPELDGDPVGKGEADRHYRSGRECIIRRGGGRGDNDKPAAAYPDFAPLGGSSRLGARRPRHRHPRPGWSSVVTTSKGLLSACEWVWALSIHRR